MKKSTIEVREMFLNFFKKKGHKILESSPIIPYNDETLLFTNAGMNQFKNALIGLGNLKYKRVTTSQYCMRAGGKHNDLDNVGYTDCHNSLFEMLGNFSFGDYFKREAINFAWELLTDPNWFNLKKERLWITVYDQDDETYNIWKKEINISPEKIIRIGNKKEKEFSSDNFWQMGETGPCGPCSEILYDRKEKLSISSKIQTNRFVEIWNLVFIQYNKKLDGTLQPLLRPAIDTGMGLERISAVLQNVNSNYEIDLFKNLISSIKSILKIENIKCSSLYIIADHIRSSVFLIKEGILPSNEGRGFILRKIIRRAFKHGQKLGISNFFLYKLVRSCIEIMNFDIGKLPLKIDFIERTILKEEELFLNTINKGSIILKKEISKIKNNILSGNKAFYLYETFGLPINLILDICKKRNIYLDKNSFEKIIEKQKYKSRVSSKFNKYFENLSYLINKPTEFTGYEYKSCSGVIISIIVKEEFAKTLNPGNKAILVLDKTPFYGESGGQVGDIGLIKNESGVFKVENTKKSKDIYFHIGELIQGKLNVGEKVESFIDLSYRKDICLNHSATHLLHSSLIQELGKHVKQRGSLINNNYLRFDFSHSEKVEREKIIKIENLVNSYIRNNLPIRVYYKNVEEFYQKGLKYSFLEKYKKIRIIHIGDFSKELCGGTHVKQTGDIGIFHIYKVKNIAFGVRRIEAVTGSKALTLIQRKHDLIEKISSYIRCDKKNITNKIKIILDKISKLEKSIKIFKYKFILNKEEEIKNKIEDINGIKVIIHQLKYAESEIFYDMIKYFNKKFISTIVILFTMKDKKVNIIISIAKNLIHLIQAKKIANIFLKEINGKGGGNSYIAKISGKSNYSTRKIVENFKKILINFLLNKEISLEFKEKDNFNKNSLLL